MENVLHRRPGNKQKSLVDDRLDDWVLHPCFAPYFEISPRHKKKLDDLDSTDLEILFNADTFEYEKLFRRFKLKFASEPVPNRDNSSTTLGLFEDEAD
jgi:hypothetical protein